MAMMPNNGPMGRSMSPDEFDEMKEKYQQIEDHRLERVEEKAHRFVEIARTVSEEKGVPLEQALEATLVASQSIPTSIVDLDHEDLGEMGGIGGEVH